LSVLSSHNGGVLLGPINTLYSGISIRVDEHSTTLALKSPHFVVIRNNNSVRLCVGEQGILSVAVGVGEYSETSEE
jgi:hypothetical protein